MNIREFFNVVDRESRIIDVDFFCIIDILWVLFVKKFLRKWVDW